MSLAEQIADLNPRQRALLEQKAQRHLEGNAVSIKAGKILIDALAIAEGALERSAAPDQDDPKRRIER